MGSVEVARELHNAAGRIAETNEAISRAIHGLGEAAATFGLYAAGTQSSESEQTTGFYGQAQVSAGEAPQLVAQVSEIITAYAHTIAPGPVNVAPETNPNAERTLRESNMNPVRLSVMRSYQEAIHTALANGQDPRNLPGFIDRGDQSYVFDAGNGEVVKIPRPDINDPPNVYRQYAVALMRCQGYSGYEQIRAYTTAEGGAVFCQCIKGDKVSDVDLNKIPQSHFNALMATARVGCDRHIQFDDHPSNIKWHPVTGFTHLDYYYDGPLGYNPPTSVATTFWTILFKDQRPSPAKERFLQAFTEAFGEREAELLRVRMSQR